MLPDVGLALAVVFAAAIVLSLVLAFRETIREAKSSWEAHYVRAVLRNLLEFRLRALLALTGAILFGLGRWLVREQTSILGLLILFGGLLLLLAFFWACATDLFWPKTPKRR